MNLSFGEMVQIIRDFTGLGDAKIDLIRQELNFEYERIAQAHQWPELEVTLGDVMSDPLTITAGVGYVAMPHDAAKLLRIGNKKTDWLLDERSPVELLERNIHSIDESGAVIYWASLGPKPTKRPLSQDDTIEIITELPDDADRDVEVIGTRADVDMLDRETITTQSVTPDETAKESLLTYKKGWSIQEISTNEGLNGYIAVRERTDATNILAHISEHQRAPRYEIALLQNPPDTTDNLVIVYKRRVQPLTRDSDHPVIPVCYAMVEAVKGKLRQYQQQYEQSVVHQQTADRALLSTLSERRLQSPRQYQMRPDLSKRGIHRAF